MSQEKVFAMSMFASQKDLFEAKAKHFEELYREAADRAGQLEVAVFKLAKQNDQLGEQNDRLERLLARHEEG
jgi:endonuclease IV